MPKKPSTVFMIDVCSVVDREMSPMSASAPVLKTPIARPETASSASEERERVADREQVRVRGESNQPDDDRCLPAQFVRQVAEEETGQRDAAHGGVLKRARRRHAQAELLDDLRE